MRIKHFVRPEKPVVAAFLFLSCRLILFCLPVSAQAEKATAAVNCGPLEFGLPLPGLPRLISGEGTECRWSGHSGAISSGSEKPSPGFWPVSVLTGSMEWLVTAWAGVGPQVLQPAQPEKRFSLQPLLSKSFLSEAEPTAPAREQRPEALRPFLIPGDLPPWQQQTLSEQWQQLQLSLSDVETRFRETGRVQLFITIIDQHIRVALSSSKAASSQQLIAFNSALHELLLAIYQMLLEQEPMDDRQEDDYSPMVSAAGGSDGDDGNNDDGFGQDDKLPDIILDFALLPGLLAGTDSDLLTLSILKQRSRLQKLRRRLARMTENGRSMMAAILRDRIMVIEADEEDLLNLAVSPEKTGQKILPLLKKMLGQLTENALMPAEYDYAGNLRQAPVTRAGAKRSSRGNPSGEEASGTSPYNLRTRKQSGQISRKRKDDDSNDDQPPGKKKAVTSWTPQAVCSVCGKLIPKNKPVVISRIENKIYCQKHHPPFILSLPELVFCLLAEYLEWKDIIYLTMTCRDLWVLRQNNPVPLFLEPLVCKMLTENQDTDITKNAYGTDHEIERRLRRFNIPEAVISKAIQADTSLYLQALHNFLLKYKAYHFDAEYKEYPERVYCLQSMSNGHFACGLGNGKVIIVNEALEQQKTMSFPLKEYMSLPAVFVLFKKKKLPVVSITELNDRRLLLGVTDTFVRLDKKVATFSRSFDKVLTSIAIWNTETGARFVFPGDAIEPGISAMVPLAGDRLAFYHDGPQSLYIWSTRKGEERELLTLPMASPVAMTHYLKEEQQLLIGHISGVISIWKTNQADPVPLRSLLTQNQASLHKLDSEWMIMKLFSDRRLAMAFPGYVWIWNIASEPVACHSALELKSIFDYGYLIGQEELFSPGDEVEEPVVESWTELHDHRLAILFRWPRQYGLRIKMIFWDTNSDSDCDDVHFVFDSKNAPHKPMSAFNVYGMMPLFGQHLLVASQSSGVTLWSTRPDENKELHYSVNPEFDDGDYTELEPPLIILSGSRILTCFGGRYLCVLDISGDQKDK